MSAIQIILSLKEDDLFCKSKWWGNPDVPHDFQFDDSLMFLCQIRCEELALFDENDIFPDKGMLYFFCDIAIIWVIMMNLNLLMVRCGMKIT